MLADMSETVDLFRQIAEALNLTPGELLAFSKIVMARRVQIREHAERDLILGPDDEETAQVKFPVIV